MSWSTGDRCSVRGRLGAVWGVWFPSIPGPEPIDSLNARVSLSPGAHTPEAFAEVFLDGDILPVSVPLRLLKNCDEALPPENKEQ